MIVWMACCFVRYCVFESRFDFTLASGEKLCGSVDAEWKQMPEGAIQLVAKTVDLKSAYKQFPICPEHRRYSTLILKKPSDGTVMGFVSKNTSIWKCGICFTFQSDLEALAYVRLTVGCCVDKLL